MIVMQRVMRQMTKKVQEKTMWLRWLSGALFNEITVFLAKEPERKDAFLTYKFSLSSLQLAFINCVR